MASISDVVNDELDGDVFGYLRICDNNASFSDLENLINKIQNVRSIDIVMLKLTRLPDVFWRLSDLRSLTISCQNLDISDEIRLPKSIDSLSIKCDTIKKIPSFIWKNRIRFVTIKANQLHEQCSDLLDVESGERSFDLNISNLKKLPDCFSLFHLNRLVVVSHSLAHFDCEVFKKSGIRRLDLHCKSLNQIDNLDVLSCLDDLSVYSDQAIDLNASYLPSSLDKVVVRSPGVSMPNLGRALGLRCLQIDGLKGELSSEIEVCKALNILHIRNSSISSVPEALLACSNLTDLTLNAEFTDVPEAVLKISSLKYLNLSKNKIKHFDCDWSALKNLTDLCLNSNAGQISSFDFALSMPKLQLLQLKGNTFKDRYVLLCKKKLPINDIEYLFRGARLPGDDLLALSASIAKAKVDDESKRWLMDYFWERGLTIAGLVELPQRLAHALNIQYKPLRNLLVEYLQGFIEKNSGVSTLDSESVIYIEGRPAETLTKVKNKIEELGARYSKVLDGSVTHVIIGKSPVNGEAFNADRFRFIALNDLFSAESKVNPKFLIQQVAQGNGSAVKSVKELLSNPESVNVIIGMKMLDVGGVPDEILESVLMVSKSNPDTKVRAQAKKILSTQAPSSWQLLIEDKQLFKNLNGNVKEQEINNKLKKIEQTAGFESAAILSVSLYRRYKKGLRFLIMHSDMSDVWKEKMYSLMVEGGAFDFAKGLGYKNWKDTPSAEVFQYPFKASYPFPKDVLRWHKITAIDFHNTKLSSVPKDIGLFKDVKAIDFSANYLASIPPSIGVLKELEELDLRFNGFKKFPANIVKLPRLKRVDLRFCGPGYEFEVLDIPESVKAALPNCEILV